MDREYMFIVDSTADFEFGLIDPNVLVINTPVMIGDEDFTNRTPDAFYERQEEIQNPKKGEEKSDLKIKTSTPALSSIRDAFIEVLSRGKDAIYATMSSTLSSTFQSAAIICREINESGEFNRRAICVDTLSMSAGISFLVRQAIRCSETTYQAIEFIFTRRHDIVHLFAVENLTSLIDSGRLNHMVGTLATLMKLKPMIAYEFNSEGHREAMLVARSRKVDDICKRMIRTMVSTIERVPILEEKQVYLLHANNPEAFLRLYDLAIREDVAVIDRTPFKKQLADIHRMGPAVGVHLGYSAFGMIYMRKPDSHPGAKAHLLLQHKEPLELSIVGQDPNWIF